MLFGTEILCEAFLMDNNSFLDIYTSWIKYVLISSQHQMIAVRQGQIMTQNSVNISTEF